MFVLTYGIDNHLGSSSRFDLSCKRKARPSTALKGIHRILYGRERPVKLPSDTVYSAAAPRGGSTCCSAMSLEKEQTFTWRTLPMRNKIVCSYWSNSSRRT